MQPRALVVSLGVPSLLLASALSGCGGEQGGDEQETPRVVASIYPLAYAAQRVMGDVGTVDLLTTAGSDPHDMELTVDQTARIAESDVMIYVEGFQPAVDEVLQTDPPTAVIEASAVAAPGAAGPGEDEAGHEEPEHEDEAEHAEAEHAEAEHAHGDDPHLWLDPLLLSEVARTVHKELSAADPERAEDYRTNYERFAEELAALDREYATKLARCRLDTVVVSHDAFGYLERYGLHFEPVAGISPESEPSLQHLGELHEVVEEHSITTVFTERLASTEYADTLAADLGLDTAVLDPIEGLTPETADEDYVSLMRANLDALVRANGCA